MKVSKACVFFLLTGGFAFKSQAQGAFYAGVKVGLGGSLVPFHATVNLHDTISSVYAGTTLTPGIRGNYTISKRVGIETGVGFNHYSYYKKEDSGFWTNRVWKSATDMEVIDLQVPISILYRYEIPSNPFRDITLTGGTSIDWFGYDYQTKTTPSMWFRNIYGTVRVGKERMKGKGGRLECGLEFQYSINRFSLGASKNHQLDSRLSLLALNFYYFFISAGVNKKAKANPDEKKYHHID